MIVIGADMHKRTHTLAAVVAATGELLDDKTAAVGGAGFRELLGWARGLARNGSGRWRTAGTCRDPSSGF